MPCEGLTARAYTDGNQPLLVYTDQDIHSWITSVFVMKITRNWIPPLLIIFAGLLAAPLCLALLLAFIGDRTLLSVVAPYATLAQPTLDDAGTFFLLAGIQYPLYGIILSVAWLKGDRYRI